MPADDVADNICRDLPEWGEPSQEVQGGRQAAADQQPGVRVPDGGVNGSEHHGGDE